MLNQFDPAILMLGLIIIITLSIIIFAAIQLLSYSLESLEEFIDYLIKKQKHIIVEYIVTHTSITYRKATLIMNV